MTPKRNAHIKFYVTRLELRRLSEYIEKRNGKNKALILMEKLGLKPDLPFQNYYISWELNEPDYLRETQTRQYAVSFFYTRNEKNMIVDEIKKDKYHGINWRERIFNVLGIELDCDKQVNPCSKYFAKHNQKKRTKKVGG